MGIVTISVKKLLMRGWWYPILGMWLKEIFNPPWMGSSSYTVTLAEDATVLKKWWSLGYGSVKKSDLTGAVASLRIPRH